MAESPQQLHLRHVILPWAQIYEPPGATLASRLADREIRAVDRPGDIDKRDLVEPAPVAPRFSPKPRPLTPALRSLGLPYKPHPSIPAEDQLPLDDNDLISLAVILDVLATHIRRLSPDAAILADLGKIMLRIAALSGAGDTEITEILSHAAGPTGQGRVILRVQLAQILSAVTLADRGAEPVQAGPDEVASAAQRIVATTEQVIGEVVLRQESASDIRFHRA